MGESTALSTHNVLILIPAFNEELSVRQVIRDVQQYGYTSLLISDGSMDRTAEIARSEGVPVLELPINLGVGGALRAGFRYASKMGYEAVVQIDADGQHPPDEIVNLINESNASGAHMVIGSRFLNSEMFMNINGIRRFAMTILAHSASRAAGRTITDSTSGFRLIREPLLREFAHQFANNYLGDTYESVISAGRGGYKIVEIPAGLKQRENGISTASASSAFRFTLKGIGVAFLRLHKRLSRFS